MTSNFRLAALTVSGMLLAACGASPASAPTAPVTASNATSGSGAVASFPGDGSRITFAGLTDGAAANPYFESGFEVTTPAGTWTARGNYGNPMPFIQFWADGGSTVNGEVKVALGKPTYFKSVDLYSSTTVIPYVITGLRNSAVVFTLTGTIGNTYGQFRTITNTKAEAVDTITIALANSAAACCRNPMGLDNIVFGDAPGVAVPTFSLSGTVTDSETGAGVAGAKVMVSSGPDYGASATADSSGAYTLNGLTQGGLSVKATAAGFLSGSTSLYLQSNQVAKISLARDPKAIPFPTAPAGATVIAFSGISHEAPITRYTESGFTVSASSSGWLGNTAYGHPAPYIGFWAEPNSVVSQRVDLAAGGAAFTFVSVELYSSTTRIPYTIVGTRNGAEIFRLSDELPNTLGNFRAVVNPYSALVDAVSITLTNNAVARNPMGLDTIVVIK
jgi:hypothetical protein